MHNYDPYAHLDNLNIHELVRLMNDLPTGTLRAAVAAKATAKQEARKLESKE